MNKMESYLVTTTVSEKEFLRNALCAIAEDEYAAADLFDCEFKNVKKADKIFIKAEISAVVNYNVDVGYKYEETYYENGQEKTKTEIKWRPMSGTFEQVYTKYIGNDTTLVPGNKKSLEKQLKQLKTQEINIMGCVNSLQNKELKPCNENFQINADAQKILQFFTEHEATADAESSVNAGDERRGFSASVCLRTESMTLYQIPVYTVEYQYRETECRLQGFAAGITTNYGEIPSALREMRGETNRRSRVFSVITMATEVLSILLSCFVRNFVVPSVALGVAVLIFLVYFFRTRFAMNRVIEENQEEKKRLLAIKISEMKL